MKINNFANLALMVFINLLVAAWVFLILVEDFGYKRVGRFLVIVSVIMLFFPDYRKIAIDLLKQYYKLLITLFLMVVGIVLSNMFGFQKNIFKYPISFLTYNIGICFSLLFFYSSRMISKKFIIAILFLSLLAEAIFGVYSQINSFMNDGVLKEILSTTTNRNKFGFLMSLALCLSISLIILREKIKINKFTLYFICISSILFAYSLLFSYSRTSWLASVMFIFSILIAYRKNINRKTWIFLGLLVLFVVFILMTNSSLTGRFNDFVNAEDSGRFKIWSDTLGYISEKPLLGYGVHIFYEKSSLTQFFPHNIVLDILFSTGIVGFIMHIIAAIILLYKTIKSPDRKILFCFWIFFFISSMFDHTIFYFYNDNFGFYITFFIFFILSSSGTQISKKDG